MPDDLTSDRIAGGKILFTWDEGPTNGETPEQPRRPATCRAA